MPRNQLRTAAPGAARPGERRLRGAGRGEKLAAAIVQAWSRCGVSPGMLLAYRTRRGVRKVRRQGRLTLPEPVKADKRSTDSSPEEMCARYTLRKPRLADLAEALDAEVAPEDEEVYKPRYNVAPSSLGWVVVYGADRRVVRHARWNYRTGAGRLLVNIRSETLRFGRFRESFVTNRCAVISDGFYEWPSDDGPPTWFHAPDDGLVLLGGLLKFSLVAGASPTFSVLTTEPNRVVAGVHDRMPVVIESARLDDWLTGESEATQVLMRPAPPSRLLARKVSKHVNRVKNDDPECIAERGPDQQGSLF